MWELDHKEGWALKNWCFWTVVLEKILESPLDYKEIKPVSPKGNQSWIFFGRYDAKAEATVLWTSDTKISFIRIVANAGKGWRQEEKGTTEDEIVEWCHWLNGHEFEQALEDGDGQGGLVCCSPWGLRESDTTEWLNNNNSPRINSFMYRYSRLSSTHCLTVSSSYLFFLCSIIYYLSF